MTLFPQDLRLHYLSSANDTYAINVNLHLSLYAAQLRQLLMEDSSYLTVGCFLVTQEIPDRGIPSVHNIKNIGCCEIGMYQQD